MKDGRFLADRRSETSTIFLLGLAVFLVASGWARDVMATPLVQPALPAEPFELQSGDQVRVPLRATPLEAGHQRQAIRMDPQRGAQDPHACLQLFAHGAEIHLHEEASVRWGSDAQPETIELRVAPDCGWQEDVRLRAIPIQVIERDAEGRRVDTQQFQIPYHLHNPLRWEGDVAFDLSLRTEVIQTFQLHAPRRHAARYALRLDTADAAPALLECVEMRFVDEEGEGLGDRVVVLLDENTPTALLEIRARRSPLCQGASSTVPLRIAHLLDDERYGSTQTLALELQLPLRSSLRLRLALFGLVVLGMLALSRWVRRKGRR